MELDSQNTEVESFLNEFDQAVSKVKTERDKNRAILKAQQCQSRVRNQLESYKLELRAPSLNPQVKSDHQKKLDHLTMRFRRAQGELEQIKQEHQRQELMQNASQGQGQQDENADTGQMALEQAQQMGDRIQDKTGKSLDRTRQQAKETLDIAANIEAQMNEQEEKLQGVGRDLDEMENSIARSKKLVGELAKAAAGDRCIQMICVLLVIGVIIMIVLFAMPKDSSAELKPE